MAYQNAQVGLAKAAFYPHITLGGSGGWQSRDIATLVNAPSAIWAFGEDIPAAHFQWRPESAPTWRAQRAAYDESVANYREAVLEAFQQVEDGLSGLAFLDQAAKTQQVAVDDSRRALDIANNRYVGGVTTYLRRHHRAIDAADERTAGDAVTRPANGHVGISGEGPGRRMGCLADSKRAGAAGTATSPPSGSVWQHSSVPTDHQTGLAGG